MPTNNVFDAAPVSLGPQQSTPDYLQQAVSAVTPTEQLLAPLPLTAADLARKAEEARKAEAEAAGNKMAQEALAADPAEMRKLFPAVYKDVNLNGNGHLDLVEIKKALYGSPLSQAERNYLTVLEAGYKQFSYNAQSPLFKTGAFQTDPDGISADSLAVLDKAVNRGINEDPYFSWAIKVAPAVNAVMAGGMAAATSAAWHDDGKEVLLWSAGGALVGGLGVAGMILNEKYNGQEDKEYDQVKTDYQSFVKDFDKGQPGAK
jgi:hypothetical protein